MEAYVEEIPVDLKCCTPDHRGLIRLTPDNCSTISTLMKRLAEMRRPGFCKPQPRVRLGPRGLLIHLTHHPISGGGQQRFPAAIMDLPAFNRTSFEKLEVRSAELESPETPLDIRREFVPQDGVLRHLAAHPEILIGDPSGSRRIEAPAEKMIPPAPDRVSNVTGFCGLVTAVGSVLLPIEN